MYWFHKVSQLAKIENHIKSQKLFARNAYQTSVHNTKFTPAKYSTTIEIVLVTTGIINSKLMHICQ